VVTEQPGYDALADLYDEKFPSGYSSDVERHAVELFARAVGELRPAGTVVDVGCGTGHQAHELASRGLPVVGVDPSEAMLAHARERFPDLRLQRGDALLDDVEDPTFAAVLARYSLIHVPPDLVPAVLARWASRLQPGGVTLVAFQALDSGGPEVEEFDHRVAPAWRWHPDAMSAALGAAGLEERWRIVTRPDAAHRFPECHLLHALRA
jgi:SAM-dependent methyltransferase